jgi:hypothetical protein
LKSSSKNFLEKNIRRWKTELVFMNPVENPMPKSPASHLHVINLVVALLAGVISITGGIYSLKNNVFSGPAYGSLQGIVRDERIAKPLVLTSVEISDLAGAVVNTATTDDRGHYLIEAIKTGSYVVKFTAPLHKIETKTIKIEKNLASDINVDLFPSTQQANLSSVESAASARQNIQAPYTPLSTYPAKAPGMPIYNSSQNTVPASTSPATYGQTEPLSDPSFSSPRPSGFRRHPHHSYPGDPVATSQGTSQSTSQGGTLAQAGTQLLQALLSKNSENGSSASSN